VIGDAFQIVLWAVLGSAFASALACVPGLHVYDVMAAAGLLLHGAGGGGAPRLAVIAGAAGMTAGYAVAGSIPSILLAAPDESALFAALPGQKYLRLGRGREAVALTALGGLAALLALTLAAGPLAPRCVPALHNVLRPHAHWVVWCVIAFMLMSEWPREGRFGQGGWAKLRAGWRGAGAGPLTFLLSGLLGLILFYRPPLAASAAFRGLMPAFVGLFTLPGLLVNLFSGVAIPPQRREAAASLSLEQAGRGVLAGCAGGGLAAFLPAVTGGVGGFLAGHATAIRDDRVFLVAQGASKVMYYAGGLLLFFVPGIHPRRGGAAWLPRGLIAPETFREYDAALAALAIGGAAALAALFPLTGVTLRAIAAFGYRRVSAAALAAAVLLVFGITGPGGLAVMAVAACIGLVPVLFGARRMNCLGVILLPAACNMSGFGPAVAGFLGLL